MRDKTLTLSIVIPAYNEEAYIGACLDAIAKQTQMPDEVIVVDNNSIDNTVSIAEKYDFVTIRREKRQGITNARNNGFNYANGEIFGRIDADTRLAPNWCETVRRLFAESDVNAVTGPGKLAVAPFLSSVQNNFWTRVYHIGARAYFRTYMLWGSNMAIRASAWRTVKAHTATQDSEVHEDQDLAVVLNLFGFRTLYSKRLSIEAGAERFWHIPKLLEYYNRGLDTVTRSHKMQQKLGKKLNPDISLLRAWLLRLAILPLMFMFVFIAATHKLPMRTKSYLREKYSS